MFIEVVYFYLAFLSETLWINSHVVPKVPKAVSVVQPYRYRKNQGLWIKNLVVLGTLK